MAEREIDPDHPLVGFTHGQPSRATYLRDRLTQVADRTTDPELAEALREVAAGRRSMRDLAGSEVFGRHAAAASDFYSTRDRDRTVQQRLDDANRAQAEVQRAMGAAIQEVTTRFQAALDAGAAPGGEKR